MRLVRTPFASTTLGLPSTTLATHTTSRNSLFHVAPHEKKKKKKKKKQNKKSEQKTNKASGAAASVENQRETLWKCFTLSLRYYLTDDGAQKSVSVENSVCFATVSTRTSEPRGGRDSAPAVAHASNLSATTSQGVHVERSLSGIAARFEGVSSVSGAIPNTPAVGSNVFDAATLSKKKKFKVIHVSWQNARGVSWVFFFFFSFVESVVVFFFESEVENIGFRVLVITSF
jgi:hypothetical protein